MAELKPCSPCAGMLPVVVGSTRLEESDPGRLTLLAPFDGQQDAFSVALKAAHGVRYPLPNATETNGATQIIWFGRDSALLMGPEPDSTLGTWAAITNQSDAWACVELSGDAATDVLARLVPVDLRPEHFSAGQTLRCVLGHMNASITYREADRFLLLVYRSMAVTLVEEMKEAMEAVAARR